MKFHAKCTFCGKEQWSGILTAYTSNFHFNEDDTWFCCFRCVSIMQHHLKDIEDFKVLKWRQFENEIKEEIENERG